MEQGQQIPTRSQVRERLASLLHEIAGIPLSQVTESATVDGELAIGSVAFVQLCVAVEEEYDIEVDPIQIITLNQFAAIVDYICDCVVGAGTWEQATKKQGGS